MSKTTISCHVCDTSFKLKETDPAVTVCACCGTDLANPSLETRQDKINCDFAKNFFSLWPGTLYLTNRRLFWIKSGISPLVTVSLGGGLAQGLAAGIANAGAGQAQVNIMLDNLSGIEDSRKGLRTGITLHTRSGESYKFIASKLKDWKDLLAPYTT